MSEQHSYGGKSGTALDDFPQPACAKLLGYECLSVDRETQSMRVAFEATAALLNPAGTVQGGFLTAMLDDTMGSMMVVLTDGEKVPSSVDIHTQYYRPAKVGRIICEARLNHTTNSTAFIEATLYNESGDAIAAATQTARLFPFRRPKD